MERAEEDADPRRGREVGVVTMPSHGRSGRPWRRLREQVLREEPYCTIRGPRCKGLSTTVDHIVPLSVDPTLAHVRTNLRGACTACNYRGGARMTNGRFLPAVVARVVCQFHGTSCGRSHSRDWDADPGPSPHRY